MSDPEWTKLSQEDGRSYRRKETVNHRHKRNREVICACINWTEMHQKRGGDRMHTKRIIVQKTVQRARSNLVLLKSVYVSIFIWIRTYFKRKSPHSHLSKLTHKVNFGSHYKQSWGRVGINFYEDIYWASRSRMRPLSPSKSQRSMDAKEMLWHFCTTWHQLLSLLYFTGSKFTNMSLGYKMMDISHPVKANSSCFLSSVHGSLPLISTTKCFLNCKVLKPFAKHVLVLKFCSTLLKKKPIPNVDFGHTGKRELAFPFSLNIADTELIVCLNLFVTYF